jgi:hypothetical protein
MRELEEMLPQIWQLLEARSFNPKSLFGTILFRRITQLATVLRKMQFGPVTLTETEKRVLAAQFFELCAQICRGQILPPKGTQNLERADLVNFIWANERERLTWGELHLALQHAGVNIPEDPEALRLWVWRAQRKGLLPARRDAKSVRDRRR